MTDGVEVPPVVYVSARARLAAVERARDAILTAEHPLAALRWLAQTMPPSVLAEVCADERVRERLREPFARVGEVFRAFADALQPVLDAVLRLGQQLVEAGAVPERLPTDPRERALWQRRHRSTGPVRDVVHEHRPRRHA